MLVRTKPEVIFDQLLREVEGGFVEFVLSVFQFPSLTISNGLGPYGVTDVVRNKGSPVNVFDWSSLKFSIKVRSQLSFRGLVESYQLKGKSRA